MDANWVGLSADQAWECPSRWRSHRNRLRAVFRIARRMAMIAKREYRRTDRFAARGLRGDGRNSTGACGGRKTGSEAIALSIPRVPGHIICKCRRVTPLRRAPFLCREDFCAIYLIAEIALAATNIPSSIDQIAGFPLVILTVQEITCVV